MCIITVFFYNKINIYQLVVVLNLFFGFLTSIVVVHRKHFLVEFICFSFGGRLEKYFHLKILLL
jgi:hypothetical protein